MDMFKRLTSWLHRSRMTKFLGYASLICNEVISRVVVKIYNLFSRYKFSSHSIITWYCQIIEIFFLIWTIYRNVRIYLFLDLHFPNTNHIEQFFPLEFLFYEKLVRPFLIFLVYVYIFLFIGFLFIFLFLNLDTRYFLVVCLKYLNVLFHSKVYLDTIFKEYFEE